jgi:acetyl-CoA carboxylase biotin carboxyl carrier protein
VSLVDKLNGVDVSKIMRLVETLHGTKLQFVRIEADGVDITISKANGEASPSLQVSDAMLVSAPTVGVFRSASSEPLGRGTRVTASTAVGSIQTLDEATAVSAGVSGLILDALVNDGEFVEYGQPLYRILAASEDA